MRQLLTRALTALTLVALTVRPAAAANKEHQQLMADIRILQEQQQILQNLIGTLGEALKEAIKAVTARLDEQVVSNRKSFADEKLVVDNLSSDLRIVREKVDDNNLRIASLTQEVDALRQAIQQQSVPRTTSIGPDAPDTPPAADAAAGAPATPAAPPPPTAPVAGVVSPTRLYDMAFSSYTSGLYDLAIDGFNSFIRSFPKHEMADDAQVHIGNSYLLDGKNEKAVEAYDAAIRTYPNGNAIPEAYYKKGLALRNLRQLDVARQAFEYCVKTYPDSDAGRLARQALMQLPGPAPAGR
jgi:tol-pal system protein YbgF